jgi:hypothetical protein
MNSASFPIENGWGLDSLMIQRMFNTPPGWRVCGIKPLDRIRPGLGFVYEGAVPLGEYTKGPKKGRTKWPPGRDCQTFTVLRAEIEAFRAKLGCALTALAKGEQPFGSRQGMTVIIACASDVEGLGRRLEGR